MSNVKIAVLVSGGGTNLQALIDAQQRGELGGGEIDCVISSSRKAYALDRARQNGIGTFVLTRKDYPELDAFDGALLDILRKRKVELVILAGYLRLLGPRVIEAYPRRIIMVHPALLPSFGGSGFYGLKVHEAALAYGVKVTGATVIYVNGVLDGGEIILQKAVNVEDGDTPETLQRRVMEQAEWEILPKSAAMLAKEIQEEKGNRL